MKINILPDKAGLSCIEFIGSPFKLSLLAPKYELAKNLFGEPYKVTFMGQVYNTSEKEPLNLSDREYDVETLTKSYLEVYDKRSTERISCYPIGNKINRLRLYYKK